MHNGYININGTKMSKSLGNFFTVRDISKEFDLIVVRLFMLSAHYRNPINFSKELIMQAKSGYERIMNCRENLKFVAEKGEKGSEKIDLNAYKDKFIAAMDDDLNTADAIRVIFELVKECLLYTSRMCIRDRCIKDIS